jgi:hypothetical protein
MAVEIAYYTKIAGVRGAETLRGEKGWSKWTTLVWETGPGGSHWSKSDQEARPKLIKLSRPGASDLTIGDLSRVRYSGQGIATVEIVTMRWMESKSGTAGAMEMHLVLKDVVIGDFSPAGFSCHTKPEVYFPPSETFKRPAIVVPASTHCSGSDHDQIGLEAATENVEWRHPKIEPASSSMPTISLKPRKSPH